MRRLPLVLGIGACALVAVAAYRNDARAALPPMYGGTVRFPANTALRSPDPLRIDAPLAGSWTQAVFDTLYEIDEAGTVQPVLAAGSLREMNGVVEFELRSDLRMHRGGSLAARDVVASLDRAARSPRFGFLLASVLRERGNPSIEAVDERTVRIRVSRNVDLGRILAAAPLAIAHPQMGGTGPLQPELAAGSLRLQSYRASPSGSAYLDEIVFEPPRPRDAEIRAFELQQIDGSWHGTSLFGQANRPTRSLAMPRGMPVLLIPNRNRNALRADGEWGALARAVDRHRLERVGLYPDSLLAPGLPVPTVPNARTGNQRVSLRLPIRVGEAFETHLAEAIAGMLDERGYSVTVSSLDEGAYEREIRRGEWDLRIATIVPALPGYMAVVAGTLAELGQSAEASALMIHDGDADDRSHAARAVESLSVLVLGHRRDQFHVDDTIRGARFDSAGRLELARIYRSRASLQGAQP